MSDYFCEKCGWRVGGGTSGLRAMQDHTARMHPPVRRLADQDEQAPVRASYTKPTEPEAKGTGFRDAIERKFGVKDEG